MTLKKYIIPALCALVLTMSCGEKTDDPQKDAKPKASGSSPNPEASTANVIPLKFGKESQGVSMYSFVKEAYVKDRKEMDIMLYFDRDDCAEGAIFGNDDEPGYLFPVGNKAWSELALDKIPEENAKTEVGIMPITKGKEGLAFWVKTTSGRFAMVRIKSVQTASIEDLISGATAKVELEWAWQTSE